MSDQRFSWRRYWRPRGTEPLAWYPYDDGFLPDPESEYGRFYDSRLVSTDDLRGRCVVLLGEPGSGKTTSIRQLAESEHDGASDSVFLNLNEYGSAAEIQDDLFRLDEFTSWIEGTGELTLLLDSLDEGLVNVRTIATRLGSLIQTLPTERLNLRIACRTADWPSVLEVRLKEIWGEPEVRVFEIAPLRKRDVRHAVEVSNLDWKSFEEQLVERSAMPLAAKPIALKFLMNVFHEGGQFPASQLELYERGCFILCQEESPSRQATRTVGSYSASERLDVACRIAALAMFSNRSAVWTAPDDGTIPSSDLRIEEIVGEGKTRIDQEAVLETLGIGLFTSRGSGRQGWAHQTYAEFLAAQWISKSTVSSAQVRDLIFSSEDGRVIPQLRGAASWLAMMDIDFAEVLMQSDPEVVLEADAPFSDPNFRARTVETLLALHDARELLDDDLFRHRHYWKLKHEGLADQLRPYIVDPDRYFVARYVAVDIAEECDVRSLSPELLEVALDGSRFVQDRINAARALGRLGDDSAKLRLAPLLELSTEEDPDGEIRGNVMRALWPDLIDLADVLNVIVPLDSHLIGSYDRFVRRDLVNSLDVADLPVALHWLSLQASSYHVSSPIDELMAGIARVAIENLEDKEVRTAFADMLMKRLDIHDYQLIPASYPSRNEVSLGRSVRRKLVQELVGKMKTPDEVSVLLYTDPRLVQISDFKWLLDQLADDDPDRKGALWAHLARRTHDPNDASQCDAVLRACEWAEALDVEFGRPLNPIDLDSPETDDIRRFYNEQQHRWQRVTASGEASGGTSEEDFSAILEHLSAIEAGKAEDRWRLIYNLIVPYNDRNLMGPFESDYADSTAWQAFEPHIRQRIINVAYDLVALEGPQGELLSPNQQIPYHVLGGYKAFRLLLGESPERLAKLPDDAWGAWSLALLIHPFQDEETASEAHDRLRSIAYTRAPREMLESIKLAIEYQNSSRGQLQRLHWVRDIWDSELEATLLELLQNPSLTTLSRRALLRELLIREVKEADEYARDLVASSDMSDTARWEAAVDAGYLLLTYASDAGWSTLFPTFETTPEVGCAIVRRTATRLDHFGGVNLMGRISEEDLADLYIWLVDQFPHSDYPGLRGGGGWVQPEDRIAEFRDSVLRQLQAYGTWDACRALERLVKELPELDFLQWALIRARSIARQGTWNPPVPSEILALSWTAEMRLIRSDGQLLDAVVEALEQLQTKLHGTTPAVRDLWNYRQRQRAFTPKDEAHLSDYIKRHLETYFDRAPIQSEREVELRSSAGSIKGEESDIVIVAFSLRSGTDEYDQHRLVIEVKGNWNPELWSAMDSQLANRYLAAHQSTHGLYVVGWFNCEDWDPDDYRKRNAPKIEIEEARTRLEKQAESLSTGGARIQAVVLDASFR